MQRPGDKAHFSIRRRHVFYISGFDPKGPAWYHDIYAQEALKQAEVSGYAITVGPRQRKGKFIARWLVNWQGDSAEVETVYDFLRWDDIMRRHWPRGSFTMLAVMAKTYWRYITTGVLYRVLKNTWATFLAGAYPAFFLAGLVVVAIVNAALVGFATASAGLDPWLSAIAGAIVGLALIHVGSIWLNRIYGIHWLIRIYAFNLKQARRAVPELDQRLALFADHITEAAGESQPDEVLIVAHSTGVQLAVSLLARMIEGAPRLLSLAPRVSFLTLGGSIPMLGWQPEAQWLRDELRILASAGGITWTDFTAAQDGATFALLDPVRLCGIAGPEIAEDHPKLLSTKLFDLFTPETFQAIRRDWQKVHFHYLMASERAADYDYLAITAGPKSLGERYAHRATTRSFERFKLKIFKAKAA